MFWVTLQRWSVRSNPHLRGFCLRFRASCDANDRQRADLQYEILRTRSGPRICRRNAEWRFGSARLWCRFHDFFDVVAIALTTAGCWNLDSGAFWRPTVWAESEKMRLGRSTHNIHGGQKKLTIKDVVRFHSVPGGPKSKPISFVVTPSSIDWLPSSVFNLQLVIPKDPPVLKLVATVVFWILCSQSSAATSVVFEVWWGL